MENETQHYIGNHNPSRTKTATAIAPTVGRVRRLDAKTKGCKRSTERQMEIRTDSHATNDILKCTFLPKLKTEQSLQACGETTKMERDFYTSLSKLAEHYRIEPMRTKEFGFPYNLVLSMWDMETNLKLTVTNWNSLRLVRDCRKTYLISGERYDTGTTLYYIPVVPLFEMLHDNKRKKNAQLLVSVCSYLYHIADIPYYRQEDSYLYWQYEMHKEWVERDDETDETECYKSELRKAELIGDRIEQKLFNPINLRVFEQRLNRFNCLGTFDQECWQIACDAYALYTEYPNTTIFRNAAKPEKDPYADDYDNEIVGMERYIAFVADTEGWLYESLEDSINNEFNENGEIEEPTICKRFDESDITATNLDFENRLFALLNDLCSLLYEYKTAAK